MNYVVQPMRLVVSVIYGQKMYTLSFLIFMMFYNLLSKFIYAPIADYLFIMNAQKVKESDNPKIQQAYDVCSRMMKVSNVMTLIAYIIRIIIILIFVGVFYVNNQIYTLLTTISLLFTIIQSTIVSMVYFIDRKIGEKMDIRFGIKLSMFFSNIIGMIFQIIYICRILTFSSNTVFHTIVSMIYCSCINYLLINQVFLSGILTAINLFLAIFVSFVLFWDYFVSNNYNNYTFVQQVIVMVFFVIVTIILPVVIFAVARYVIQNSVNEYSELKKN